MYRFYENTEYYDILYKDLERQDFSTHWVLKLIPHEYQGMTNFYQLDHSILFKTFQY